jgi:hypothetical protein
MGNKYTTIKERFKQVADNKGISYKNLFEIIQMSDGGFKGANIKRPINSNAIENILTKYPDIDLHWLITGKETRVVEKYVKTVEEPAEVYKTSYKDKYLEVLEENRILHKQQGIAELKNKIKELECFNEALQLRFKIEKDLEELTSPKKKETAQ